MSTLHAHVESESADCDGRYSRTYVMERHTFTQSEDEFIGHVMDMIVSTDAHDGTLKITQNALTIEGRRFYPVFEWSQSTEEGFTHSKVTFCLDDDADAPATQRDHSAEAAGY